jgi:hypothetical protein
MAQRIPTPPDDPPASGEDIALPLKVACIIIIGEQPD